MMMGQGAPGMPMQGGPPHHLQGPPGHPQPPPGAQMRPMQPQPQQQPPPPRPEDVGRLAKSRDMIPVLHEKWNEALKDAGAAMTSNSEASAGQNNRFETSAEDFFSTLDQIELNLKCAAETSGQSQATSRYMMGNLNYHQHISTARHQVNFTNQIRDMLKNAAQDIVDHSIQVQQQPQPQQQQQPQQQHQQQGPSSGVK